MTILEKYNRGDSLSDIELLNLQKELEYYSGETMPKDSWFHLNLNEDELSLLQFGARVKLMRVEDIIKSRGVEA